MRRSPRRRPSLLFPLLPSIFAVTLRSPLRPPVRLLLVPALLLFLAGSPRLHAQGRAAVRHTVDGTVVDGNRAALSGVVVYLENPKSLDVQSYLSDAQGHFHFNHISPQTDYELWAEQNGVESKHQFISQFSSHIDFHFTLKVTPNKKKKLLGLF